MKVKGYVKIGDHIVKNQIQPSFVYSVIQYMLTGGQVSNYKYVIQLMSNNNVIGAYSGSLQYKQVGSTLQLKFTFIIPNATSAITCLQLYLLNSLGNFLVSIVQLSKPLPSGTISICWFLCFQISPADYFTPYIIFSLFAPPSSSIPFVGTPLPNVQTAINEITTVGYLTSPPTYYFTYSGNQVQLTPQTTANSFLLTYKILSNSSQQLTNVGIIATASSGNVTLVPQVPTVTLQAGQVLFATYSVLWET
ncbi:hypothetical protein AFV7_gp44 [Betalipothrixvirus pezzuloense]|uniref:Uncharacterized protein n=1 Tax=Betalipothrixvirus pezzuloense TaxID=346883 RepID=A7WKR1_9VIRU|nr:hypothetical protein AFV7_gp44 [Acidianus filamentous virus 7]CAJ31664.1 conserved hypothetical protein [Acidianus filamentous virus 7]